MLTLNGSVGNIQWQSSPNSTMFTDIPGEVSATYTATNLTVQNYYQAVVSNGTCSAITSGVVINIDPPADAGTITGNLQVCAGKTTALNENSPGGIWSSDNTLIASVDAGGLVTGVMGGTANIIFAVTNGYGCTANTTTSVTVNALPVVLPIMGYTNACLGSVIPLTDATPGGSWISTNPLVASVSASGVVTVGAGTAQIIYTVTNASGCMANVAVAFAIDPPLVITPITGNSSVCIGSTIAMGDATGGGVWTSSNPLIAKVVRVEA